MSSHHDSPAFRGRKVKLALTDDEYDVLKAEADRTGKPMTVLFREALFGTPGDSPAVALLKEALFLRMNGERPPGHENATWRDWDLSAEAFLRLLLPPGPEGEKP